MGNANGEQPNEYTRYISLGKAITGAHSLKKNDPPRELEAVRSLTTVSSSPALRLERRVVVVLVTRTCS